MFFVMSSDDTPVCPVCGGTLKYRDTRLNILVCGNLYSGNVETDIPVAGNRLISAWLIVPCIDVICPALAA